LLSERGQLRHEKCVRSAVPNTAGSCELDPACA
jgi:hypothetical protein